MSVSTVASAQFAREEKLFQDVLHKRKEQQKEVIKQMESEMEQEIDSLAELQYKQVKGLRDGFNVEITNIKEQGEDEIHSLNVQYEKQITKKEEENRIAFKKISAQERIRIESYKKKQEEVIASLHNEFMEAQEEMRLQFGQE